MVRVRFRGASGRRSWCFGVGVLGAALLAGCGGGGGGGGAGGGGGTGVVARVFPPYDGLSDDDTLVVRGTASSPDGIAGVLVAGTPAQSNDGFATWTATVPLTTGDNVLSTVATTGAGATLPLPPVTVTRIPVVPTNLTALAYDAGKGELYVVDEAARRILRVVEATGVASVVSGDNVGSGPRMSGLAGLALDLAAGVAYVGGTSAGASVLFAVDLATGNRTVASGPGVGSGAALGPVHDLEVDGKGLVVVADPSAQAVVRIDPADGSRTPLSGSGVGAGPAFGAGCPTRVVLDEAAGRLFASGNNQLFAVDLATGDRTLVSGNGVGNGPSLIPVALALDDAPTSVIVARNAQTLELLRVDLATGDRTPVPLAAGSAETFTPAALHLDAGGQRLLLTDPRQGAIQAVALKDGLCTDVWRPARGTGPTLCDPSAADLEDDVHLLIASNVRADVLVRLDLATGDRTLLGAAGSPLAAGATAIARDPLLPRALVIGVSSGQAALLAFDLATGDRSILSGPNGALGTPFNSPFGLATDGVHAWVTNGAPSGLLRVDLATGQRTTVSDPSTGGGVAFTTVNGLALDLATDTAYVGAVDATNDFGLFSIDLVTGDRAPVSTFLVGSGPPVYAARVVRRAADGALWSIGSRNLMVADPITGARVEASGTSVGHGPALSSSAAVLAGPRSDGLAIIVDAATASAVLIDPVTGERLIVAR